MSVIGQVFTLAQIADKAEVNNAVYPAKDMILRHEFLQVTTSYACYLPITPFHSMGITPFVRRWLHDAILHLQSFLYMVFLVCKIRRRVDRTPFE